MFKAFNNDVYKCRICCTDENLLPIFENKNNQIALNIFICTSVKIIDLDKHQFPSLICQTCLNSVNEAIILRQKGQESEKYFRRILDALVESGELELQDDCIEPVITVKLENECIKTEQDTASFDIQNIDSIIENCTTVFEDAREEEDPISDEDFVEKKYKRKKKTNFDCKKCSKSFSSKTNLNQHMQKHRQDKVSRKIKGDEDSSLYCDICQQFFSSRPGFQKHIKIKHDFTDIKDRFSCDFCDNNFVMKYYLVRHIKEHHSKVKVEKSKIKVVESPIPCEVCGKILRNRGLLKPHMRSHKIYNSDDYYYCDLCPRKFKTRGGCVWHIQQRHILKTTFPCTECSAVYKGKWELKCHIKSKHTTIRDFFCEICGKGFLDKQKLTIHTRIHTGERPHACHFCPQTFIHQTDLRRHIWGHTGERPYKCEKEGCGKGFMKKSELLSHENRCHRQPECQIELKPSKLEYQMM